MRQFILIAFFLFFCPAYVSAAPQITEIMYDPSKGGEWIEIYNSSDTAVDIKGWKIFDGTSHTIPITAIVPAGGYLILADDRNAFISAFNDITIPIIDIVTSMNNDGDTVILRDASGADISTMSYTTASGASKNNKSLQLIGSEYLPWFTSIGTGAVVTKEEIESATPAPTPVTTPSAPTSNTNQSSPYHTWPSDAQVFVSAGGDKISVAGADVVFQGKVLSAARKPLPNADLIWTFGDGGSDRGTQVKHIFHYPGRYVVLLDVISGDYIAKDQIFVEVITPKISLSNVVTGERSYVEIFNSSIYDLDIGGWVIEAGGLAGTHFTIPKNTIVLASRKIIFPSQITKLNILNTNVALRFPNSSLVAEYKSIDEVSETKEGLEVYVPKVAEDKLLIGTEIQEMDIIEKTEGRVAAFLSKHITSSVFKSSENIVAEKPLPINEIDQEASSSDILKDELSYLNSTQTVAAPAVLSRLSKIKNLIWLLIGIVVIVGLVLLVRYADNIEKKDLQIDSDSEDYKIIE